MKTANSFIVQIAGIMISLREGVDCKGEKWKTNVDPAETFDEILVTGKVYRHILANVYDMLVKDKSIGALELLSDDEKQKIKTETKKILKGRLVDRVILMDLYKSVYTLSIITQQ